jgi:Ni/Fe-hydrogenase subunit HybB-like protein
VPELFITFGIVAAEILIYIWAVKRFPILSGAGAARARA